MFVIKKNISLKGYNTFGIDVATLFYANANTIEKIIFSINFASYNNIPILVQGAGSNTLFISDFNGVIIHPAIKSINVISESSTEVVVRVGAGVVWDEFVDYCVQKGFYGVENLSHIPGDVGASPVQNIGAYGVEAKDTICKIDAIDTETRKPFEILPETCNFGYRTSVFKSELRHKAIITYVWFKLKKSGSLKLDYGNLGAEVEKLGEPSLKTVRQAVINIRSSKLPDTKELGSAGSFFKNPIIPISTYNDLRQQYPEMPMYAVSDTEVKIPAGWLIEHCGWKGKRVGNCGVYEKQALVLVNYGDATGSEVIDLAKSIQNSVNQKFGVLLDMEVNIIS